VAGGFENFPSNRWERDIERQCKMGRDIECKPE